MGFLLPEAQKAGSRTACIYHLPAAKKWEKKERGKASRSAWCMVTGAGASGVMVKDREKGFAAGEWHEEQR